ncbi:MAG: response regulator [Deltaproteobacteria bacterium]|nr:response regulator [Deltaproteobacteria bacterium]
MAGFLIVEDDRLTAGAIARVVRNTPRHELIGRAVLVAHTAAQARTILLRRDVRLAAAIFDVKLPDGDGLELIAEFRDRLDGVPVLVLTGHHAQAEFSQKAFLLDAAFVAKPADTSILRRFILKATTRCIAGNIDPMVHRWIRRYQLTTRQAQLLASAVAGDLPETFRAQAGDMSRDRYKELVGEFLDKCHRRSVEEAVNALLREAVTGGAPAAPANGGSARKTNPMPR